MKYLKEFYNNHFDNPEFIKRKLKKIAVALLNASIKRGDIKRQPCKICGKIKSEGHHSDYSKPLKVEWVCKTHHTKLHLKLRRSKCQKEQ